MDHPQNASGQVPVIDREVRREIALLNEGFGEMRDKFNELALSMNTLATASVGVQELWGVKFASIEKRLDRSEDYGVRIAALESITQNLPEWRKAIDEDRSRARGWGDGLRLFWIVFGSALLGAVGGFASSLYYLPTPKPKEPSHVQESPERYSQPQPWQYRIQP